MLPAPLLLLKIVNSTFIKILVQLRLKSIQNIGKITKSMKMIASTKLNRAQKTMEIGRTFARTSQGNQTNLISSFRRLHKK